jgi:hypothetical protein
LIDSKKGSCKVHTFGIGDGVSTELIIEGARAGNGSHCFIRKLDELEAKVLSALQKNMFPYLVVKQIRLLDQIGAELATYSNIGQLSQGSKLSHTRFIETGSPAEKATHVEVCIYDPLRSIEDIKTIPIEWTDNQAFGKLAGMAEVIKMSTKDEGRSRASVKHQVLDVTTAMIAWEKIMDQVT